MSGDLRNHTEKSSTVQNSFVISPNQDPSISQNTHNTPHNANKRHHPDDGGVIDTRPLQTYEGIVPDTATLSQYNHLDGVPDSQHDNLPANMERYNWQQEPLQEDNQYPFDGYNVEDLWEWMLYFDSQSEVISNAHT